MKRKRAAGPRSRRICRMLTQELGTVGAIPLNGSAGHDSSCLQKHGVKQRAAPGSIKKEHLCSLGKLQQQLNASSESVRGLHLKRLRRWKNTSTCTHPCATHSAGHSGLASQALHSECHCIDVMGVGTTWAVRMIQVSNAENIYLVLAGYVTMRLISCPCQMD